MDKQQKMKVCSWVSFALDLWHPGIYLNVTEQGSELPREVPSTGGSGMEWQMKQLPLRRHVSARQLNIHSFDGGVSLAY